MKVNCIHGYFTFHELHGGDISYFRTLTGFDLTLSGDKFIFTSLKDAPRYSILGGTFMGAPCTKTFEGEPWEVMRQNSLVYDFVKDKVLPILTVIDLVEIFSSDKYLVSNGMLKAGSLTDEGKRVTDYSAHYLLGAARFKYSEVNFE